jgi:hypothetical protein
MVCQYDKKGDRWALKLVLKVGLNLDIFFQKVLLKWQHKAANATKTANLEENQADRKKNLLDNFCSNPAHPYS